MNFYTTFFIKIGNFDIHSMYFDTAIEGSLLLCDKYIQVLLRALSFEEMWKEDLTVYDKDGLISLYPLR